MTSGILVAPLIRVRTRRNTRSALLCAGCAASPGAGTEAQYYSSVTL